MVSSIIGRKNLTVLCQFICLCLRARPFFIYSPSEILGVPAVICPLSSVHVGNSGQCYSPRPASVSYGARLGERELVWRLLVSRAVLWLSWASVH